jgi:hypothetical protein
MTDIGSRLFDPDPKVYGFERRLAVGDSHFALKRIIERLVGTG